MTREEFLEEIQHFNLERLTEVSCFVRSISNNKIPEDDINDILEESLLKVCLKYETFKGDSTFLTWFYSIVKYTTFNFLKKRTNSKILYTDEISNLEEEDPCNPQEIAITEEAIDALNIAIAKMKQSKQNALTLHLAYGFTAEEIAEELNIPRGTASTSLFYGKRKIKEVLGSGRM
jgi:RNA polymerase sigma-70 factor (ECF subfamily)